MVHSQEEEQQEEEEEEEEQEQNQTQNPNQQEEEEQQEQPQNHAQNQNQQQQEEEEEEKEQEQQQNQAQNQNQQLHRNMLPKRIILIRHGESQGNLDTSAYTTTPDHKIPLTSLGIAQARRCGSLLSNLVSCGGASQNHRVYFYVSPYERTRSTLREIGRSFSKNRIIGVREECRIREQDFGNFQVRERMKKIREIRERFGRFYYRFPEGESAADVFDRVSSFFESLWRDIDLNRLQNDPSQELNLIIISHGLASRVFLMKWFKWTVEQFEHLNNPGNCELRVMQLGQGGDYSLAIHHTEEELIEWGLSPEMIADQKWRANANKGEWNERSWYLEEFFDPLAESEDDVIKCEGECLDADTTFESS